MKKLALLTIILFFTLNVKGQNLILNSSFEQCDPLANSGSYSENPGINNWKRVGYIDVHSNSIASLLDGMLMGGYGLQHIDLNGTLGSVEQVVNNLEVGKTYVFSYYTSISVHIVKQNWIQRAAFQVTDTKSSKVLAADSWTLGFNDRANWKKHSFRITAESSSISVKFFSIAGSSTSQHGVLIDSVSLFGSSTKSNVSKLNYRICYLDTVEINGVKYFKEGIYKDTIKNSRGEDSILMIDIQFEKDNRICNRQPFYLPNVFTPNGDPTNNVFKVYGNDLLGVKMQIFNRWGEKLFDMNDLNTAWDGKYKDEICEDGVYLYLAEIKTHDGIVHFVKGTLTLLH